ncbi:uncharacterized protein LOC112451269 [Kryptolebias marmoratus]|uniref:uncharacterized protein LOC112451269 n=1 Tax=Kryptolebias marmoratus TaxID=37003 RepID=UPI000D530BAD|nr:uncharacterized protein LOC112451269 [Kryptolebias marmoratus]
MPGKPAKYGLKLWVCCDAQSSYVWKMQMYEGKRDKGGAPEKNLATRVVMDVTDGLCLGTNVTIDNFFTLYELAAALMHGGNGGDDDDNIDDEGEEEEDEGEEEDEEDERTTVRMRRRMKKRKRRKRRRLTLLSTVRANRRDVPGELLETKGREAHSSRCVVFRLHGFSPRRAPLRPSVHKVGSNRPPLLLLLLLSDGQNRAVI